MSIRDDGSSKGVVYGPPYRNVLLTWSPCQPESSRVLVCLERAPCQKVTFLNGTPYLGFEPESAEPTDLASLQTRKPFVFLRVRRSAQKKCRALSRSAFCVNPWAAKFHSRLKGSPFQTLFVTTRARPDSGSRELATRCRSSSPLRWPGGNELSSNFFDVG